MSRWLLGWLCLSMVAAETRWTEEKDREQPNIIFVLADDLGWSDVGWNNELVKTTPFMDGLLKKSTKLTQAYATHRCSPTRAAILTGRYSFRYGMGTNPIPVLHPTGLPLSEKLLPEFLKEVGYESHVVGKWHLGFCNSSYHPLNRGFDSFFGFLGSEVHYKTHMTLPRSGVSVQSFRSQNITIEGEREPIVYDDIGYCLELCYRLV